MPSTLSPDSTFSTIVRQAIYTSSIVNSGTLKASIKSHGAFKIVGKSRITAKTKKTITGTARIV